MLRMLNLLRILAIALALSLTTSVDVPSAEARPDSALCKKKKRKAKKRRTKAKKTRKRAAKKVTYKQVSAWWNAGLSQDEIVKRAKVAGYWATPKDEKRLKKKHLSGALIAALVALEPAKLAAAETAPPKKIDFKTTIDPESIDFDEVAAPKGAPKPVAKAPEKKGLDTSLRPSAPFKGEGDSDDDAPKKKRVVFKAE